MQEWLDELTYYRGGSFAWLARARADRPQLRQAHGVLHGLSVRQRRCGRADIDRGDKGRR